MSTPLTRERRRRGSKSGCRSFTRSDRPWSRTDHDTTVSGHPSSRSRRSERLPVQRSVLQSRTQGRRGKGDLSPGESTEGRRNETSGSESTRMRSRRTGGKDKGSRRDLRVCLINVRARLLTRRLNRPPRNPEALRVVAGRPRDCVVSEKVKERREEENGDLLLGRTVVHSLTRSPPDDFRHVVRPTPYSPETRSVQGPLENESLLHVLLNKGVTTRRSTSCPYRDEPRPSP